jgi:hypothetical protein
MKKNILAKTFTPSYDRVEDRIRVCINYQDLENRVDFMITRAFIINLIPAAEEFALKNHSNPYLPDVEEKSQNENNSFSKTDGVNLELFKTEDELLREINFSYNSEKKVTTVTFTSKNVVATTLLDDTLFSQVFNLIKSAIPFIEWGISHHF